MRVFDSYEQEMNNFDIVVVATTENGSNMCKVGIYYNTFLIILGQAPTPEKAQVDFKRYPMFMHDGKGAAINRVVAEAGGLDGDFEIRGALKIDTPNEEMYMTRALIIDKIQSGQLKSTVNRNVTRQLLEDAEADGRI